METTEEEEEMEIIYQHPDRNRRTISSIFNIRPGDSNKLIERDLFSLGYNASKVDSWPTSQLFEKPNLYLMLLELIRKRLKANAIIIIGQNSEYVHLMVLQSFSRMFRDIHNVLSIELPMEQVTPRSFKLIYDWMIEDKPLLTRLGLLEVWRAANFLQIPQLELQCEVCLAQGLNEESAFMLYLESRILKMEQIQQHFLERVSKFFLSLVASQEFLSLAREPLLVLLGSSMISVNTELEVFMSAVRWLNYQWPQRKENISEVVAKVRFALIPPWLLIRLQKPKMTSLSVERIAQQAEVRQFIHDGIAYTTTRLFYGNDRDSFREHLQRTETQTPEQRMWIYDRACSHHHRLNCKISEDLTYEMFIQYLNHIQMQHKDYWQSLEPVGASPKCLACQRQAEAVQR
ncbi:uncharacterized protein Dwil_GK27639 [Drosophila willistoni]|uniref:kelch repeat and BTB domain-containing protein 8 n=1 Tax=Drosophila willistoni TaxID=7260 RepID=UPI000732A3DD|nr:kelch repeat and BTB domain-containing protein 8 [Drosophila willistoni]KRF97899.1 uncharacterized protein Dwil_GK27639 [Drosophila willistoni]